jgi:hypothetical protein
MNGYVAFGLGVGIAGGGAFLANKLAVGYAKKNDGIADAGYAVPVVTTGATLGAGYLAAGLAIASIGEPWMGAGAGKAAAVMAGVGVGLLGGMVGGLIAA